MSKPYLRSTIVATLSLAFAGCAAESTADDIEASDVPLQRDSDHDGHDDNDDTWRFVGQKADKHGRNTCPLVDAVAAPLTAAVNESIKLTGYAVDRDGPRRLSYRWSSNQARLGTIDDRREKRSTFKCRRDGSAELWFSANDGDCARSKMLTVICTPPKPPTPPALTITAPADNATFATGSVGLCKPASGTGTGVTVTGTVDTSTRRTATVSVNGGRARPFTLSGTTLSGCVPIQLGTDVLEFILTNTSNNTNTKIRRTIALSDKAPTKVVAITNVSLPADPRLGTVTLTWTLPTDGTSYTDYQLHCDVRPLDVTTASPDLQAAWWNAAHVVPLPSTVKPPQTTTQIAFRVGETNQCVLRGVDSAQGLTPLVSSTLVQVPFRQQRFAPTSTGKGAGAAFAAVGDINGDNIDDLLASGNGEAYLVFGSTTGWTGTPNVVFTGGDFFGYSVVGLGDFDGDTRSDFAIGDFNANGALGRVLVYYGRIASDPWPATVNAAAGCSADVCFEGPDAGGAFGSALAAGRFDSNDTRPDLLVGASGALNQQGRIYVLRGAADASGPRGAQGFYGVSVALTAGTARAGFVMSGDATTGFFGTSLAVLPGATHEDFIVTSIGESTAMLKGAAYLLSGGRSHPGAGLIELARTELGTAGAPFDQGDPDLFGALVVSVGNVYDLPGASRPGTADLAVWQAGFNGFWIYPGDTNFSPIDRVGVGPEHAVNTDFGTSIASGFSHGDLDNDGLAELFAASNTSLDASVAPGSIALWYGDVFSAKVNATTATPRGIDTSSASLLTVTPSADVQRRVVEIVGDLNGDGKQDLAVGGPGANANSGEFTILY